MRQFYETYRGQPKLAALLRELTWTHNFAIMSRSKRDEEREFYLRMAARERWSFRELQRQLNGALFVRTVLVADKTVNTVDRIGAQRLSESLLTSHGTAHSPLRVHHEELNAFRHLGEHRSRAGWWFRRRSLSTHDI